MEVWKLFSILLITLLSLKLTRAKVQPKEKYVDDLVQTTANRAEELKLRASAKMARTSNNMLSNIETIMDMAMAQLAEPLAQANQQITASNSAECWQLWDINELRERIDFELRTCMQDVSGVLMGLRADSDAINSMLQSYLDDIANLPVICQTLSAMPFFPIFMSKFNCVNQRIADLNDSVHRELQHASDVEIRARQLLQMGVTNAQQCTREVVAQVLEQLLETVEHCL